MVVLMNPFAEWLNEQMTARGLSQADVADDAGVTTSAVSRWLEPVKPTQPKTGNLQTLAKRWGYPEDDLLRLAGHKMGGEPGPEPEIIPEIRALLAGRPASLQRVLVLPILAGSLRGYDAAREQEA